MALLDYGALVKKDGVFINRDQDLFMDCSDTGYVCEMAKYKDLDSYLAVKDNFYAYVGDEDLLLIFYKCNFGVISDNELLHYQHGTPSIAETFFPMKEGLPEITISHLDETVYEDTRMFGFEKPWSEFVKHYWYDIDNNCECTGNEDLSVLQDGYKVRRRYLRALKKIAYLNRTHGWPKYRTNRFVAKWNWNGHEYEVIYGQGIDPDTDTWEELKKTNNDEFSYGFTDKEIAILDEWFN